MYDSLTLIQFLIGGLTIGCIYGLVGIGFSVIYNSSGIINFAQGGFVMLGGMLTFVLFSRLGIPMVPAIALATLAIACFGVAIEMILIRRLRQKNAPIFIMILATLACQILIEDGALHLIDDRAHSFPPLTPGDPIRPFGLPIQLQTLWIAGVSLTIVFLLGVLYRRTLFGKAMRACAINPEVASILGIKVEAMVAWGFALSAALGAIGGVLITPTQFTAFYVGMPFAVNGFVAAIIGGLGNPFGAFIGGILLGLLQTIGVAFIDSGYKNLVVFVILIALLFVRPQGLFGSLIGDK